MYRLIRILIILPFLVSAAEAFTVSLRTASGDSVFYAAQGDTVSIHVSVNSEQESITGFELFLGHDPNLFLPIDTDSESLGNQPARSSALFGQVFADSVIVADSTTSVVHYAEVDLVGGTVEGVVFTIDYILIAPGTGTSSIRILQDLAGGRSSLYTPASGDGETVVIPASVGVVYQNLPPTLSGLNSFTILEDQGPAFLLRDIAEDEEPVTDLAYLVTFTDTTAGAVVDGDSLRFSTPLDFNGQLDGELVVRDPAGGEATDQITLTVITDNDKPVIDPSAVPDTVLVGADPVVFELAGSDVDNETSELIWFALVSNDSLSADLDGATLTLTANESWNGQTTLTLQLADPGGLVDIQTVNVIGNAIQGDFDGSGDVGFTDFLLFAGAFGNPDADPKFDLDGSGLVDFPDFLLFAANFGN